MAYLLGAQMPTEKQITKDTERLHILTVQKHDWCLKHLIKSTLYQNGDKCYSTVYAEQMDGFQMGFRSLTGNS